MLNCTGSMRIAAISPRWRSRIASSASASLYGATTVSSDRLRGRPAEAGTVVGRIGRAHQLARRLDADEHVVVVAVVAALELEDLLAAGEAARDTERVHRRLGARVREAHEVGPEAPLDLLGEQDAVLDRERVAGAVRDPIREHLGQDRVRVARGQHAERHVEVDVLVAVGVDDARAARVGHEQRVRLVGLEGAGDAERQRPLRALVEGGARAASARRYAASSRSRTAVTRARSMLAGTVFMRASP